MTHDPTAQAFAAILAGVDKDLMKDYPQPATPPPVSATMFKTQQEIEMTDDKLTADRVIRNGFTENLGTDEFVAIDDLGNVIARSDRATLERDYPNAHFFGAKDLGGNAASVEAASVEAASVEAENAGRHARTDELQAEQAKALAKDGVDLNADPLDHDHDGRKGGNVSARKRKPAKK